MAIVWEKSFHITSSSYFLGAQRSLLIHVLCAALATLSTQINVFFFITVDECFISKLSKSSFITSQSYVYVNFFYTGSSSSNNGKANSQSTSKHWYPTPYFKNASDCWRETKSRRWISGEELHSTNFSGNYAANCLKFSLKNFVIVRYVQRWLSPHSEYTFSWNLMHSVFIMLSY